MKKKALTAALAAAFVLTTAGSVFADPLEFNGQVSFQHRVNTDTTNPANDDFTNNIFKVILNAKAANVIDNVDLYFRFGGEHLSDAGSGRDFNKTYYGADKRNAFALDQFGFVYKAGGFNYKIGRQDITIGATALLYNNDANVGKHGFVDGVTVTGKSGITDLKVIAAEADSASDDNDKVYSISASYPATKDLTLGATVAKYDSATDPVKDANVYAINASYAISKKLEAFGEFAKSDASDQNKAFDVGLNYAFDNKTSAYVITHKTEANADLGGNTDFENNEKGWYYGVNHKLTKDSTLKFFYKDNKYLTGGKETSFRTTYVYKF